MPGTKLDSVGAIRREMGVVYREGRQGKITPTDMNKFVWALRTLADLILNIEIEGRVEALESAITPEESRHVANFH